MVNDEAALRWWLQVHKTSIIGGSIPAKLLLLTAQVALVKLPRSKSPHSWVVPAKMAKSIARFQSCVYERLTQMS